MTYPADRRPRDRRRRRGARARTPPGRRRARGSWSSRSSAAATAIPAAIGKSNCCANLQIIGVHRDGGFADYLIAPVDEPASRCPTGSTPSRRAFAEPVAIGVQACRRGMVSADGHACSSSAPARSASRWSRWPAPAAPRVYVTDLAADRLATAAELGADAARRPAPGCSSEVAARSPAARACRS